jgi:nitronate monooxygenase
MPIPQHISARLRLPVVASPLYIVSNPDLVIAQCQAGVVGSFPALNARPAEALDSWLQRITTELARWDEAHPHRPAAPFAVNQIVHDSNDRLAHDLELCVKYRVPVVITSLGVRRQVIDTVHAYGGWVLHDVISNAFARKAIDKGVDGLIAVAAGAGGHAGAVSPFALVQEIREWYDGLLLLGGCIGTGDAILAAQACGADLAYVGTPFIATLEAGADPRHKQAVVDGSSEDIVYTNVFTGIHANFLRSSLLACDLDPEKLDELKPGKMEWGSGGQSKAKVWKDIWSAGQGIGRIKRIVPAAELIAQLSREYATARERIAQL